MKAIHKIGEELRRLKKEDPEKLKFMLSQLTEEEAHSIVYDPDVWMRPDQQVKDEWPEPVIMFMAGRGWGKSFCGCQWIRKKIQSGKTKGGIVFIAPTASDLRDTIVFNTLMPLSDPLNEAPEYEPSKSRVVWKNGTIARLISAENGAERVRGGNNEYIWIDELGSIPDKDVFDQALLTLRVGESKCLITTTPRPTETIIYLYKNAVFNNEPPQEGKWVRILTGSTFQNFDNLSEAFKRTIVSTYEGTRVGRQELEGKLLLNAEGALWNMELLMNCTLDEGASVPKLQKIAVGIDPAMTDTKRSDITGIVVAAIAEDDKVYVLEDLSGRYSPDAWVSKVHSLYDEYSSIAPTSIITEVNQGGSLVTDTLRRDRPFLPVDAVFATKSKLQRAEPVAMLYEQGKVFHTRGLQDLEDQMVTYEGLPKQKSPDRLDALVMAITHLMPSRRRVTKGFEFLV
jgi:predicted phage terminase large subunit-like protein